jgi:hypothetical protein
VIFQTNLPITVLLLSAKGAGRTPQRKNTHRLVGAGSSKDEEMGGQGNWPPPFETKLGGNLAFEINLLKAICGPMPSKSKGWSYEGIRRDYVYCLTSHEQDDNVSGCAHPRYREDLRGDNLLLFRLRGEVLFGNFFQPFDPAPADVVLHTALIGRCAVPMLHPGRTPNGIARM